MARVNIDGKDYELTSGQNLLQAVLSEHLELPYFCWHPAMGSVGSCRLCAIIQFADADDGRGRLQMACMVNVQDGMRVSINAEFAADFRKQVIEWLMENHPPRLSGVRRGRRMPSSGHDGDDWAHQPPL